MEDIMKLLAASYQNFAFSSHSESGSTAWYMRMEADYTALKTLLRKLLMAEWYLPGEVIVPLEGTKGPRT